jgi:hypothetical protein
MKKLYISLLTAVFASGLMAQHSITTSDLPVVGEFYTYVEVDSTMVTPTIGSGSGQTWNYSAATVIPQVYQIDYKAPSGTPYSSSFSASSVAEQDGSNYVFYRLNGSNQWQMDGLNINISGLGDVQAIFSDQGILFNSFPYTLNSSTPADPVSGTIAGALTGTCTGTVTTTCPSSGTLILQGGTFSNVILVKSVLNLSFTAGFVTGTIDMTRLMWLNSTSKAPLFEDRTIDIATGLGSTHDNTVLLNNFTFIGVPEVAAAPVFNLFPSPATKEINVAMNLNKETSLDIEIMNQLGQVVYTEKMENVKAGKMSMQIDISPLASGVYFIRTKNETMNFVKKFVVE